MKRSLDVTALAAAVMLSVVFVSPGAAEDPAEPDEQAAPPRAQTEYGTAEAGVNTPPGAPVAAGAGGQALTGTGIGTLGDEEPEASAATIVKDANGGVVAQKKERCEVRFATTPRAPAAPAKKSGKKGRLADDIDVSNTVQIGKHREATIHNAAVTRALLSATISRGSVVLEFDELKWKTKTGKKTVDGGVLLFWPNRGGAGGPGFVGGWFDHHGVGQKVKTLSNVPGGYIDGQCPMEGSPVFFGLISYDGTERTNIVRSQDLWPHFK